MTKSEQKNGDAGTFLMGLGKVIWLFLKYTYTGAVKKDGWSKNIWLMWLAYGVFAAVLTFAPKWNPPYLLYRIGYFPIFKLLGHWLHHNVSPWTQLYFIPLPLVILFFIIGLLEYKKRNEIEASIKHLGLKTSTGLEPKVLDIVPINSNKTKILVQAIGIDVAEFASKKGALESSLNKIVQDVRVSPKSRQVFEIITSDKDLPKMIRFDANTEHLKKPYSFLVGESNNGFVTGELKELHHMLIAGSTGGGKSVFFKQALIGLLKSSSHVHLYLIDLKRGVEMRIFESLPNVFVAKNVVDAIACLKAVEQEMNRRFEILEKKKLTEIAPVRDKLDRLVVGIDEASVLFTVEKGSQANKALANEARELTDKLTKLGRAAGIHVILATQKVTKETIDTRVQTNIHAKICFRVNTLASSMTVIGNKKAAELPEIRGRAIWSVGSKDIEVQVPYLSHEEATDEVETLHQKFSDPATKAFQELLMTEETLHPKPDEHSGSLISETKA